MVKSRLMLYLYCSSTFTMQNRCGACRCRYTCHNCKELAAYTTFIACGSGMMLQADVAILEEPEHLNWFQHTTRWTDK